jgi:hypothetical protein
MKEKEKTTLPEGVTQEQIAEFKKKYGDDKVKLVHLYDDKDTPVGDVVACVPGRRILGMWEKFIEKDPDKSKDILVKNCLLSSKEKAETDEGFFLACARGISELIPLHKAVVENL